MKKQRNNLFRTMIVCFLSVAILCGFSINAKAATTSTSSKYAEMNKKIKAIQKKYQATDYDIYHIYDPNQVTITTLRELFKEYIAESKATIAKAKAQLPKYKGNSLYAKSKTKQLQRTISIEEEEIKGDKVIMANQELTYPIEQQFYHGLLLDWKNPKAQIAIIKCNYYHWQTVNYLYSTKVPSQMKRYDEIQQELKLWKSSKDSHKNEMINSLTDEYYKSKDHYTTLNFKKTLKDELEFSKMCNSCFTELYNIVKKY